MQDNKQLFYLSNVWSERPTPVCGTQPDGGLVGFATTRLSMPKKTIQISRLSEAPATPRPARRLQVGWNALNNADRPEPVEGLVRELQIESARQPRMQ
jgi:hypothetical protein